jgi:hypothetical protein
MLKLLRPQSTTSASLSPTPLHISRTDTPLRNPISQTYKLLSAPMTTWLYLFRSSTRQMPSVSSTKIWPRTLPALSNAGSLHSNATWKSFLRKPLEEAVAEDWEKKARAKNGGRAARVDFGAVRWRERVLACGSLGRARRIRKLIPKQRSPAFAALTSNIRSVETPLQFSRAQRACKNDFGGV